jgi:(3S)-linalool synthase
MSACMNLVHSDDLFDATLAFRLLREAGHGVSASQWIYTENYIVTTLKHI